MACWYLQQSPRRRSSRPAQSTCGCHRKFLATDECRGWSSFVDLFGAKTWHKGRELGLLPAGMALCRDSNLLRSDDGEVRVGGNGHLDYYVTRPDHRYRDLTNPLRLCGPVFVTLVSQVLVPVLAHDAATLDLGHWPAARNGVARRPALQGVPFPPGPVVGVPAYSVHRSREIWGDDAKFRPERWTPGILTARERRPSCAEKEVGQVADVSWLSATPTSRLSQEAAEAISVHPQDYAFPTMPIYIDDDW
ncbi:hypothetical protein QBC47DRAFT_362102 [Echria macrotheca]|uniref:Uncharacterized protein n=1 Tax=Echria macrotheca TaxID=438768 RepID=A0AAJ0B9F3_9PEZI|nr:hypothetical protein QBC47DRAFT_362102 [Echria macrotheca]